MGALEGGAEKSELPASWLGLPQAIFCVEWHRGFWEGSCLKMGRRQKAEPLQQSRCGYTPTDVGRA